MMQAPVPAAAQTATQAPTGFARWFDPETAPFIPVPLVDTSPDSGVTVGLIPVFLHTDANGQIDRILAPDITHSSYFGWGADWRIFRNPSDDQRWSVVADLKEHAERGIDAEFDAGLLRDRRWSWTVHGMYDRSATGRFYGLGNGSKKSHQTTYVDSQIRVEASVARNFSHTLQLAYNARLDTVEIEQGVLANVTSIDQLYPALPGVGDEHELQHRLTLSYDTRDSPSIPRSGERAALFVGRSQHQLLSSVSYTFFGADASLLRPVDKGMTLAAHAALRLMPAGGRAPFWALSSLGGDRSVLAEAQPLRGFGYNRFVDRNSFDATVELRTRVVGVHAFGTDISLEPAPFIDTGKVYRRLGGDPFSHLHTAAGLGLRMVAVPFIVGYLDIGYGKDGVTVFTGIDYPF